MYGSIVTINSTKKVTKKLAWADAGSASLATNVGNERGEIVQCHHCFGRHEVFQVDG